LRSKRRRKFRVEDVLGCLCRRRGGDRLIEKGIRRRERRDLEVAGEAKVLWSSEGRFDGVGVEGSRGFGLVWMRRVEVWGVEIEGKVAWR